MGQETHNAPLDRPQQPHAFIADNQALAMPAIMPPQGLLQPPLPLLLPPTTSSAIADAGGIHTCLLYLRWALHTLSALPQIRPGPS